MKYSYSIFFFLLCIPFGLLSQESELIVLKARIIEGDTVPVVSLREIEVLTITIPKTKKGQRKLTRLVKNVKKVYPYAKLAGKKLLDYEEVLLAAESDKARRKIMKQAEIEIKEEANSF